MTDHDALAALPLTKRQIIERDEPLLVAHPLRHGDHCPSRRMRADMTAVDGPCSCGLTATIDAERGVRVTGDAGLDVERLARAYIRVRHAHNPTADEIEDDEEVRPCAWCRLAAKQHIEADQRYRAALTGDTPEAKP